MFVLLKNCVLEEDSDGIIELSNDLKGHIFILIGQVSLIQ